MVSSTMAMAAAVGWGRTSYTTPNAAINILRLQRRHPPAPPLQVAPPPAAQQPDRGARNGFLISISSSSSSSASSSSRHGTSSPGVSSGSSPPFIVGGCWRKKTTTTTTSTSTSTSFSRKPSAKQPCLVLLIGASLASFAFLTGNPLPLPTFRRATRGAAALVVLGLVLAFVRFEFVPYTERWHIVLLPPKYERLLGAFVFDKHMEEHQAQVLPPNHSYTVRVRSIMHKILGVMEEELGIMGKGAPASQRRPQRVATHHLEGLKWEVAVVDKADTNAFALPGGKIVVYRGMLDAFQSDAEIATFLGHEIAHVVGRHSAETIGHLVLFLVCKLVLTKVLDQFNLGDDVWKYLIHRPFSRRLEMEADRIGLLLSSAAGYDPRIAPVFYRTLGSASRWDDYISTHPSGEARAKSLSEDTFMKKAIQRYEETIKLHSNQSGS